MSKVNLLQYSKKEVMTVKKRAKKEILTLLLFITLTNLPFLTIMHQVGIDLFLDSFDHPGEYHYMKDTSFSKESHVPTGSYLLLQRSSHPSFAAHEGDMILYYQEETGICCDTISAINTDIPIRKYYLLNTDEYHAHYVYEPYIIGKVVGTIDDNIWTSLSITAWDLSINNFNIRALFTQQ